MTKQAELPLETGLIVDEFVERFESVLEEDGMANLADFLPSRTEPYFLEVASELVRVEIEYRHKAGDEPRLQDYREVVPQIFDSKQHLQQIAFEEYRLRRIDGEATTTGEYRQQFEIDTAAWVQVDAGTDGYRKDSQHETGLLKSLDAVDAMPVVGETFDEFDLVDTLGRGTFAEVFLARQRGLADRLVALKVSASSSGEADKLARLQHTNIVPIYSLHSQDDLKGVCMPYLGVATLADVLGELKLSSLSSPVELTGLAFANALESIETRSEGRSTNPSVGESQLDQPEELCVFEGKTYTDAVASVMASVSEGLAFAHRRGIVHRDIKPGNVLMAIDGEPRLLDFNLSDDTLRDHPAHLFVGGTLPYMSPEQLESLTSGAISESASDVYSCGVMLYEMLTLKNPFPIPQGSFDDVVDQMIVDHSAPAPAVSLHNRTASSDFDAIIAKCLHRDPQHRYPSAFELAEDLNCHLDSRPLKHAANTSLKERLQKWARRHPRITSASTVSAVAAVCLITLLGFLVVRNGELKVERAAAEFHSFERDYALVRSALSSPIADESIRGVAVNDGQELFSRYWNAAQGSWRKDSLIALLPEKDEQVLRNHLGELEQLVSLTEKGTNEFVKFQQVDETPEYLDAVSAIRARDYARAKVLVDRLRDLDSSRPSLWLLSANAMAGLGELSQAESYYSVYIGLLPEHYVGYFYRGLCRLDQKDFRGAEGDFSRVVELRPELSSGWLNRSLARLELSDFESAHADLDTAIDLSGVSTRAYALRSKVRRLLGDPQGSEHDLETFMTQTPSDSESWVQRGTIQVRNSPERALRDFERALELDPTNRRALNNSVYVLIEVLNQRDRGLVLLDRMLEIDQTDDGAIAARAVLLARMGRRNEARSDVKRLLDLKPSAKRVYQAASAYALTSGDFPADSALAIQRLNQAFRLDPSLLNVAKDDPDLDSIRDSEGYIALVKTVSELVSQEQ